MRTSKTIAAVTVGTIGVLALGACSSGSDQAQPDREAEAASPTAAVTMPTLKSGPYKDVWVTKDSSAVDCKTPYEEGGNLIVHCQEVGVTVVGDPVFIGVPNDKYRISVARTVGPDRPLVTIQRNMAYIKVNESTDEHTVWNSPYKVKVQKEHMWGVGMSGKFTFDGSTRPTSFWAVVTKIS